MMSCMCSLCFNKGLRVPFIGVAVTGTVLGSKPADRKFQRNICQAFQEHMLNEHGIEVS